MHPTRCMVPTWLRSYLPCDWWCWWCGIFGALLGCHGWDVRRDGMWCDMRGGMVCDGICAEAWYVMGSARRDGMIWDMRGGMAWYGICAEEWYVMGCQGPLLPPLKSPGRLFLEVAFVTLSHYCLCPHCPPPRSFGLLLQSICGRESGASGSTPRRLFPALPRESWDASYFAETSERKMSCYKNGPVVRE
jgi:hypothetical protein